MSFENVRLPSEVVDKVRKNKEKTGVTIIKFVEMAIEEKLEAENKKFQKKQR